MARCKTYDPDQTAAYEVTLRYRELHRLDRPAVAALLAGRLDPAAIRREPKTNLVQVVLTAEFGAARMPDWKEGMVAASCASGRNRHPHVDAHCRLLAL